MDKYEFKLKADQIVSLVEKKDYKNAAKIADGIDWRRVRSIELLLTVSEAYEKIERYEDSFEILNIAYDRAPIGRTIVYRMVEVATEMGNYEEASELYNEYIKMAPHDLNRYILKYKIYRAKQLPVEDQIAVLEEFKNREYHEKWAYELAKLYYQSGMEEKCVEECDDLILWFSEGEYVRKAMELKMLIQPLTPSQQQKYDAVVQETGGLPDLTPWVDAESADDLEVTSLDGEEAEDETPQEEAVEISDILAGVPQDDEIHVRVVDPQNKYSTVNLQAELAEGLKEYLVDDNDFRAPDPDEVSEPTLVNDKPLWREQGRGESIPVIDTEDAAEVQVPAGSFAEAQSTPAEPEAASTEEAAPFVYPTASESRHNDIRLGQSADGQMTFNDEENILQRQITGQVTIQDILAEWEEKKRAMEEKMVQLQIEEEKKKAERLAARDELARMEANLSKEEWQEHLEEQAKLEQEKAEAEAAATAAEEQAKELTVEDLVRELEVRSGMQVVLKGDEEPAEAEEIEEAVEVPEDAISINEILEAPIEAEPAIETPIPEEAAVEEPAAETPDFEITEDDLPVDLDAEPEEDAEEEIPAAPAEITTEPVVEDAIIEEPAAEAAVEEIAVEEPIAEESPAEKPTEEPAIEEQAMETSAEDVPAGPQEFDDSDIEAMMAAIVAEALGEAENRSGYRTEASEPAEVPAAEELAAPAETPAEPIADEPVIEEPVIERPTAEVPAAVIPTAPAASEEDDYTEELPAEDEDEEAANADDDSFGPMWDADKEIEEKLKKTPGDALTPEQQTLFAYFTSVHGMKRQLGEFLAEERMRELDGTSVSGNIVVTGESGNGKTTLALDLCKALQKQRKIRGSKVARISGEDMNQKDPAEVVRKLSGGSLIIEQAGALSAEAASRLSAAMLGDTGNLFVILEDDRAEIEHLFERCESLGAKFNRVIEIPAFNNNELVAFGRTYAEEQGYVLDDMAVLALYNHIGYMQTSNHFVNVSEVKDMVDDAIAKATKRKVFSKVKKDSFGNKILLEKHFEE